ncbi:hypothetical protein [Terrabacter sp. NPDC080008]|uniref:hypothetical protein n=1 Tax=Terrabacter sp. NPDC080008 TaxID=3155176 RepID=UPI00344EB019
MTAADPAPNPRELILELVELQDRIDEVRGADPEAVGSLEPADAPQSPELAELVEREEEVIAELRDYRETQLRLPTPPSP